MCDYTVVGLGFMQKGEGCIMALIRVEVNLHLNVHKFTSSIFRGYWEFVTTVPVTNNLPSQVH